jgi:putative nucleotidyltransferase with HDIG domain
MSGVATTAKPEPGAGKPLPPELQKALGTVTELASLPEITTRIVQVVEDPRATARDIQDLVRSDPALATKVLKIVNSAFYGLPSKIASLERAILMLGLNSIKNLALAASLARLLRDGEICSCFTTRDLWRHSIAVAVAARSLAQAGKTLQPDEAFVAGLVHDMGLIVSQQLFPEKMWTAAEECMAAPQSFCALEQQHVGADHQAFGGALAVKWKFPPGLRNTIAYHHEPAALQPEFQPASALVYLADGLCCRAQLGFWLTAFQHETPEWMLALAGLSAATLEQVASGLPERLAEAEQIFTTG